jgi:hypothetical protein
MFEISPTMALTIYIALGLILLLSLWLRDNYQRSKKTRQPPLFQLYICEYCQFPYLDETTSPVTRCPQCKSMNKDNAY